MRDFKATLPHERFNSGSSRKMPASFLCAATSFSSAQTSFVLFKQRVSRQRTKRWWAESRYRCQNSKSAPRRLLFHLHHVQNMRLAFLNDLHPNQILFYFHSFVACSAIRKTCCGFGILWGVLIKDKIIIKENAFYPNCTNQ